MIQREGGLAFENYYLYRLAIWLIARLPRGWVYASAAFLAELFFLFDGRARRGVYANQGHVLAENTSGWQRWRAARQAFRNFAYSVVDFFRIPLMNRQNMDHFVGGVDGWEHVMKAMTAGTGGIFITVHMGSWELAGAYLGLRQVPLTVVALPHKDPRIDRIFLQSRQMSDMEVVSVGGALRKLEDAITRGRLVGLVADRDVTGRGPVLPFFGQPTHVPHGHAVLALHTGAPILPGCVYRRKDGLAGIEIRPPIHVDRMRDSAEEVTRRCLLALEEIIRARPEQWSSFYDLWSEQTLPVHD